MRTWQRYWGFMLVAIEATVFAYLSNDYVFPATVTAFAAFGMMGRVQFALNSTSRVIAAAIIAAFLGVYWRTSHSADAYTASLFLGSFGHPLILYLMTLQAGRMYIRDERGLGSAYPALAIAVMVCVGDLFTIETRQDDAYRAACLAFVVALCGYLSAPARRERKQPARTVLHHARVTVAVTLAVAFFSWLSAHLLIEYRQELDKAYIRMLQNVTTADTVGFGQRASLDNMSNMRLEDHLETQLRIYSERPPGYLRGKVYDTYSRGEWLEDTNYTARFPLAMPDTGRTPGVTENAFRIRNAPLADAGPMHVWPVGAFERTLFSRLDTAWIALDSQRIDTNRYHAINIQESAKQVPYHVFAGRTGAFPPLEDDEMKRLVPMTNNVAPEVKALAETLFADKKTAQEKIAAVEQYFIENYSYQLGIHIPSLVDPLTYFLTERPNAHCEFFASGAAYLLRLADVPTRYVTGFVVTEYNPVAGFWIARSRDAHAWVEAYVPEDGWVIVEATPPDGVPHAVEQSRFSYWWDSFRQRLWEYRRAALQNVYNFALHRLPEWLMPISAIGVPLLAVATLLFAWRHLIRPRKRGPSSGAMTSLGLLLRQADEIAREHGHERSPSQTLHQFAAHLESDADHPLPELAAWYRAYAKARYLPVRDDRETSALTDALRQTRPRPASAAAHTH